MSSSRRGEIVRGIVALVAAVGLTAALGFGGTMALRPLGLDGAIAQELVLAVAATVALLLVGRYIERRAPAALGFAPAHLVRDLALGTLLGAALIGGAVGVLALTGAYVVREVHFPVESVLRMFLLLALVAWFEEVLFRGIIFRILAERFGAVVAYVVSAALFGGVHLMNPHASWIAALAIAVEAGVLLGAIFWLRRSLWMAIGMHFAWNFVQGPVLGAPVSGAALPSIVESSLPGPDWLDGGAFGPEAGAAAVVICVLAAAAVVRAAHFSRRKPA